MELFDDGRSAKVAAMPGSDSEDIASNQSAAQEVSQQHLAADEDLLMEQILENINHTPLGRVLKKIASLPEARQEKVLDVRRKLTEGRYQLDERLDAALERVLEELTT